MDYFHHPSFDAPTEHDEILRSIRVDDVLDKEQEFHLFRQMNFCKHLATKAKDHAVSKAWLVRYQAVRTQLVTLNLRLAKHGAKVVGRRIGIQPSDLLGDANLSLLIAIDKFNYNRGFRFSTYALWVIFRRFSRSKETERANCADPAMLGRLPDRSTSVVEQSEQEEQTKQTVNRILERLDPRKRKVIRELLGIDCVQHDAKALGLRMGITDERVRQLHNRAVQILQELALKGELEV